MAKTWNYRLIRHKDLQGSEDSLCIHEVYYDEYGNPVAHSDIGAVVQSEDTKNTEGIEKVMEMMRDALEKPILNANDFEEA